MNKIEITNPDKVLFPKERIKKIDLAEYYASVCKLMMPYLEDRLLSVIRCHQGIDKEIFFKKHPTTDKTKVKVKKVNGHEYFYINKCDELIYQVQSGTIEFHTWASKVTQLNRPDVMVFDLDPDEKLSLSKLRDGVERLKTVLDELGLKSFLKTSGGKGYHVVVPFSHSNNWQQFYSFSKQIAMVVENKWPKEFTTNIKKSERQGKIFVDYLRNNKGSTCVAPFSVRARTGASISMPIKFELLRKIKPNEITIKNYRDYCTDAWRDFYNVEQKLR